MPKLDLHSLALRIRKSLPGGFRRTFRLVRQLRASGESSRPIPSELFAGCRMCASREELVGLLPTGGRVAEIGTATGRFARHILAVSAPDELHLVDLDFSELDTALTRESRVVLHRGHSHEVLASFPDAHFDWIYIDADHSYEAVRRDAEAAAEKVKAGGYLVFNDFAHIDAWLGVYGVHRAVVEFAVGRRWPFAWFAYSPDALYDVALRRPGDAAAPTGSTA